MAKTAQTTILLIEDSPTDVRLIKELLLSTSHDSFHVMTASTLAQGLELLSANSIDAVLLDLGLPDSQGLDTLRAIYAQVPSLPIVVLTVSDDEALGQQALREGAQRFLSKDTLTLGTPYAGIFTRMIRFAIEQKQTESRLIISEEQLLTLFEFSPIVQLRYDPEGSPVVANRAAREFLGISDVSAIQHLSIFTSPRVSDADKARLRAGKPTHYEQTYDFDEIKRQGAFPTTQSGVRYVDFFLAPIFDKKGAIGAYLAQVVDITERKWVEAERESVAKFPEENPHPVLRFTPKGTVLFKNTAGEVLLENPLLPLDDVRELVNQAYASGKERTIEATDGTRTFQLVIVPVVDQGYVNVYGTNITGRRHAEEALQQAHEEVQSLNKELQSTTEALHVANEELEQRVQERTTELAATTASLKKEVAVRQHAEEAAKVHAQHEGTLSRIISAGNRAASLQSALASMLDAAVELLGLDHGGIFLRDGDDMILQYTHGYTPEQRAWSQRIPVTQRRNARIMTGIPWISDDYQAAATPEAREMNKDLGSMATIPLMAGDAVVGFYQLSSLKRQHHFTGEEQDLLVAVGREAGTVIARMQAEEDAQQHAYRADALSRIILRANQTSDLHGAATAMLDAAVDLLGFDGGLLYLRNDTDHVAELCAWLHASDELITQGRRVPLTLPNLVPVYRGEAWLSEAYDDEGSPEHRNVMSGVQATAVIPLIAGDKVIGHYGVWSTRPHKFRQEERALFETIGREAGTVFARLQAEEHVREYSEHLEDLVEERTAQLAQSEEYFRTLFEASSVGQIRYDADGRPIRLNRAAATLLGIIDIADLQHITIFSSPRMSEEDKARLRGGHPIQYEQVYDFKAIRAQGGFPTTRSDVRYVDIYMLPIFSAAGEPVEGYLAQYIDITERKKAEAALKRAERLAGIGETATMIGHDLRNPLQALQLLVDLGQKYYTDLPPEAKARFDSTTADRLFSSVEKQIQYMDKIVSDLQDYARPLTVEPERVHVGAFITDTLGLLTIPESISVNVDVPGALTATADPHLMRRVLANLVLNAVQAMPEGGELTIGAAAEDSAVAITIHDTGEGVPEDMKEGLFSPLTTGKAKGTGLGLAVVKRIVEAHGGTIIFESGEGNGTTFTVTLPQP